MITNRRIFVPCVIVSFLLAVAAGAEPFSAVHCGELKARLQALQRPVLPSAGSWESLSANELEALVLAKCSVNDLGQDVSRVTPDLPPVNQAERRPGPAMESLIAMAGTECLQAVDFSMPPSPPTLPNDWLRPSLGGTISAPHPAPTPAAPAPPVARALPGDAASGYDSDSGQAPCDDLKEKARRLRSAAEQCDSDVANGAPYCNVKVTFNRPSIPRSLSAESARSYADDFERISDGRDESACSNRGGEGRRQLAGNQSLKKADGYYSALCRVGDEYACKARQIAKLCFDTTPKNNCVRNCLVDRDELCVNMNGEADMEACRKRNHWVCYMCRCDKYFPEPSVELRCVSEFTGWREFLSLPNNVRNLCRQ